MKTYRIHPTHTIGKIMGEDVTDELVINEDELKEDINKQLGHLEVGHGAFIFGKTITRLT